MNALAEEQRLPRRLPGAGRVGEHAADAGTGSAPRDQQRDRGEPSLIAGITRQVMRDYAVDPRRVYVAGLSAGGAAAAIMGAAYPDLYAAVGVHSGLPCGAARDMPSAFAAMRQGRGPAPRLSRWRRPRPDDRLPRRPRHAPSTRSMATASSPRPLAGAACGRRWSTARCRAGTPTRRTVHADAAGGTVLEQWVVARRRPRLVRRQRAGSYTDPRGPTPRARCCASSSSIRGPRPRRRDGRTRRLRPRSGRTGGRGMPDPARRASAAPAWTRRSPRPRRTAPPISGHSRPAPASGTRGGCCTWRRRSWPSCAPGGTACADTSRTARAVGRSCAKRGLPGTAALSEKQSS